MILLYCCNLNIPINIYVFIKKNIRAPREKLFFENKIHDMLCKLFTQFFIMFKVEF